MASQFDASNLREILVNPSRYKWFCKLYFSLLLSGSHVFFFCSFGMSKLKVSFCWWLCWDWCRVFLALLTWVLFFQVCVDPSGMYVVCSHSDRYMRVYDFATGELLAQASGHAEVITGVTFLPDCRRLISVSSLRRNSSIPLLWDCIIFFRGCIC